MQERRLFPRYPLSRSVLLQNGNGDRFAATSSDISEGGIGLLIDRATAVALAQGGAVLTVGDRFDLVFAGPDDDLELAGLLLDCRVRYIRRLSMDRYCVGAMFEDVDAPRAALVRREMDRARQV